MAKFIKKYIVKVYSQDGTYKDTIKPKLIMSDISFSEDINGGQSNLVITLNLDYGDTTFSTGDIVNVLVYDSLYKNGKSKYWGYVEYINRIVDERGERIELSLLGYYTLLTEIIYDSGGKVFTKNDDPKVIIDDIVDYFNTKYPFPGISKQTQTFGISINLEFNYTDCLSAIRSVQEKTDYYFFLNENCELIFAPKPSTSIHKVKLNYDLLTISTSQTIIDTVNKVYVERSGGTILSYEDLTSQSSFGLREKKESKTDIQDLTTQNTYGTTYIEENKDPKFQTELLVNYKYGNSTMNMEDIRPGETITVLNTKYKLTNLQIQKIDYNSEFIKVYLDKYEGLGDLLVLKK